MRFGKKKPRTEMRGLYFQAKRSFDLHAKCAFDLRKNVGQKLWVVLSAAQRRFQASLLKHTQF